VTTNDDLLVAAGHSVDPGRWLGMLDELMLRVGARFRRVEPRRRARAFVLGLLAGLTRIAWITWNGCAGRMALRARPAVAAAGGSAMAGLSALAVSGGPR
jgi:hypothetical protein